MNEAHMLQLKQNVPALAKSQHPKVSALPAIRLNFILAAMIQKRWHDLGYTHVVVRSEERLVQLEDRWVHSRVEGREIHLRAQERLSWEITSNLVDGLPPPRPNLAIDHMVEKARR